VTEFTVQLNKDKSRRLTACHPKAKMVLKCIYFPLVSHSLSDSSSDAKPVKVAAGNWKKKGS